MPDIEDLIHSPEFAAVKAAVEALDPVLLGDVRYGSHLMALRTGMARLSAGMPGTVEDTLSAMKERAVRSINRAAEEARNRFITAGSGQAMTYQRKEAEARAWSGGADEADLPFLSAEAAAIGMPMADLVAEVIGQADAWVAIGKTIEATRRGALVAIGGATNGLAVKSATIVAWPQPVEPQAADPEA